MLSKPALHASLDAPSGEATGAPPVMAGAVVVAARPSPFLRVFDFVASGFNFFASWTYIFTSVSLAHLLKSPLDVDYTLLVPSRSKSVFASHRTIK